jgi:hypothetical protein
MHLQPSKVLDRTLRRLSSVDEGPLLGTFETCQPAVIEVDRKWSGHGQDDANDPMSDIKTARKEA